jgi:hypothetical protein
MPYKIELQRYYDGRETHIIGRDVINLLVRSLWSQTLSSRRRFERLRMKRKQLLLLLSTLWTVVQGFLGPTHQLPRPFSYHSVQTRKSSSLKVLSNQVARLHPLGATAANHILNLDRVKLLLDGLGPYAGA